MHKRAIHPWHGGFENEEGCPRDHRGTCSRDNGWLHRSAAANGDEEIIEDAANAPALAAPHSLRGGFRRTKVSPRERASTAAHHGHGTRPRGQTNTAIRAITTKASTTITEVFTGSTCIQKARAILHPGTYWASF